MPEFWFVRTFRSNRKFIFDGKAYAYYYSMYGTTWRTERSVEIPIVWSCVQQYSRMSKRILEVGNVLSYRFSSSHKILDKYEKGSGIINEDVAYYRSQEKYDLIVSISTLEHVGWDEQPKEPTKILTAIDNLKSMLSNDGMLIVTLPVGQNYEMDKMFQQGLIKFDKIFYMDFNKGSWVQVPNIDYSRANYDLSVPRANTIIIGISKKKVTVEKLSP